MTIPVYCHSSSHTVTRQYLTTLPPSPSPSYIHHVHIYHVYRNLQERLQCQCKFYLSFVHLISCNEHVPVRYHPTIWGSIYELWPPIWTHLYPYQRVLVTLHERLPSLWDSLQWLEMRLPLVLATSRGILPEVGVQTAKWYSSAPQLPINGTRRLFVGQTHTCTWQFGGCARFW